MFLVCQNKSNGDKVTQKAPPGAKAWRNPNLVSDPRRNLHLMPKTGRRPHLVLKPWEKTSPDANSWRKLYLVPHLTETFTWRQPPPKTLIWC